MQAQFCLPGILWLLLLSRVLARNLWPTYALIH
jgi:hypothetical protein